MNIAGTQENHVAHGKFVRFAVKAVFYRAVRYIENFIKIVGVIIPVSAVGELYYRIFFIEVGENIIV